MAGGADPAPDDEVGDRCSVAPPLAALSAMLLGRRAAAAGSRRLAAAAARAVATRAAQQESSGHAAPMAAAAAAVTAAGFATVYASDDVVHPAKQDWDFNGYMSTYDAARCSSAAPRKIAPSASAQSPIFSGSPPHPLLPSPPPRSIRRGHQVYTEVCASCHGLSRIAYRNPRFGSMPILINECDFRKKPGWVEKSFAERYDSPAGLMEVMEILKVMLDQPALAEGHSYFAVGGRSVSPDNNLLIYGVDTVSRRQYTLYVKDLSTGEIFEDRIPETTGGATWANDNKTLFYTKKDPVTLRSFQIYKHVLGTDVSEDVLVFEEKDETYVSSHCFFKAIFSAVRIGLSS